MKTYHTFSSEETMKLGEKFAARHAGRRKAIKNTRKAGTGALVFALQGDLGAGKTTFVQGFFKGLGLKKRAPSPTFVIMRRHGLGGGRLGKPGFKNIFHIDAYRLKTGKDLAALDFKNVASDPRNIILIEWADRVKKLLPRNTVWLKFTHSKTDEHKRSIIMKP